MHTLQAAWVCKPFAGGTRPPLLRRGSWSSKVPFLQYIGQQHALLGHSHPDARQQSISVTVQAQSRSAAEDSPQVGQPVLKQSLSKSAVNETAAEQKPVTAKLGTLWGLLILSVAYVHHSTCGYVWHAAMPHCLLMLLASLLTLWTAGLHYLLCCR